MLYARRSTRFPHRFRLSPCTLACLPVLMGLATSAAHAADSVAAPAAAASAAGTSTASPSGQSIVVMGKRHQTLHDTAGSVSAVNGEALQAEGAQSLADYIQEQPGVVFNADQAGISNVVVRGIATSSGNVQGQSSTGFYLNEVPLTEPGWAIEIPDIDTFDLNRVEVYRGPQGTLFGSASMGGAVQYVTNEADTKHFDAAVEGTVSQTHNADAGGSAKGMINVPIQPGVLGIRAVAEYRKDPGYIDNIGTGKDGANTTTTKGGRVSAVLTPVNGTRLSWMSLWQSTDSEDGSSRLVGLGSLQRSTALPEYTNTKINVNSLRLDQDVGFATLTALGGYVHKWQSFQQDFTADRDYYNSLIGIDLTNPLYMKETGQSDSSSLEVRLTSKTGGPLDWVVGGFYSNATKYVNEMLGSEGAAAAFDASADWGAGTGATIAPNGSDFDTYIDRYQAGERALFGEASYAFAPQWKVTLGGRYFETRLDQTTVTKGLDVYPTASTLTKADASRDHGFTPKVSISYDVDKNTMVYALASEGYRFGVPNEIASSAYASSVPKSSQSDKLWNYELGTRTSLLGGKLDLNATLFYIDWRDIQLRATTPDYYSYAMNGGRAHSAGFEFASHWRPTQNWDYTTSLTYQQARLDDDVAIASVGTVKSGAKLPGSSDWSFTQRLSYYFGGVYPQMVSLSHQYISRGFSDLNSQVEGETPLYQGGYSLFDVRYRISVEKTDVSLFMNNIFDRRGVTRTGTAEYGTTQALVRPRTVGVTVAWHY